MKKVTKFFWVAIIAVAALDAFSTTLGAVPVLGDIIAIGGNLVWEIIELALVFGLVSTKGKGK